MSKSNNKPRTNTATFPKSWVSTSINTRQRRRHEELTRARIALRKEMAGVGESGGMQWPFGMTRRSRRLIAKRRVVILRGRPVLCSAIKS